MTTDEIARLARGYAIEFCREHGVAEQDADDYIQEGIVAGLQVATGRAQVARSLVRVRVRGAILDYHKKWANGGIGGRDAAPLEHVYMSEAVPGASDEDGADITFADVTAYEDADAPNGYRPTEHEADALRAKALVSRVMPMLGEYDRELLGLRYHRGKTQEETAAILGITQQAAAKREATALKHAREIIDGWL